MTASADPKPRLPAERRLRVLLWFVGATALLALPAAALPTAWMDGIHRWLGLGDLPRGPMVEYLTRSLSLMYVTVGALMCFMAGDVRRYAPALVLIGRVGLAMGVALCGVDLWAGLPAWWWVGEPVATVLFSFLFVKWGGEVIAHERDANAAS